MKPSPKIALALGGGAARGFAHVGVIKALEAQGMARSSAARKLSAIRQFHRFLHGDGIARDNPATAIDSPTGVGGGEAVRR